jgi:hypothetical protein
MATVARDGGTGSWVGASAYSQPARDSVTGQWIFTPSTITDAAVAWAWGPAGTQMKVTQNLASVPASALGALNAWIDTTAGRLAPSSLFFGYSSDGVTITIPRGSIPGLSVVEADAVTGDARAILLGVMAAMVKFYTAAEVIDRFWTVRCREHHTFAFEHHTLGVCDRLRFVATFHINDDANNLMSEP